MDISEKERKGLLELAMSSLPTGLFICDRDGIIRFINDAYAHYLHLRPEDALGRPITDFIADWASPPSSPQARPNSARGGSFRAAKQPSSSTASPCGTSGGRSSGPCP
ncbi:MAG: PAS domain-containing protein [Bilophila sp.]